LEQTLKEKAAKGIFWGGISSLVQQIVGLAFGIAIARILSPGDYGLVGMLAIFSMIASTILDSGFTAALANKKEIKHEDYNAVFWFNLFAGVLMYVILFLFAPLIAQFYEKPALTNLSRALFLSFFIGGTGISHYAIMYKKIMVKEQAKIDILSLLVSGSTGLIMALNGFAYWGLVAQNLTYGIMNVALRWHYSPWRPTFHFNFKPLKEMFGFSFKVFLSTIFWHINNNLFSVLLGKFYNENQVGYYTQGNKWMTMGEATIRGMIKNVAQPVFVESIDDKARLVMIFRKMLRFGAFVSFPTMLGLAFIGEEFILISIGEKWLESVPFFQLLCIWGSVSYIWSLYGYLLYSYGKSDIYLYGNIMIYVLQLICVAIMFPFGIFPMIIAYIVCNFMGILMWHYFANKLIRIRLLLVLKDILPYLTITAGCFFIAWLATQSFQNLYLRCALKIAVTATLYVLIMKYSRSAIFKESIEFITNRIKK
jgi:O-antigen/teichoic acid export membrane protein